MLWSKVVTGFRPFRTAGALKEASKGYSTLPLSPNGVADASGF